jgi:phosphoribosylformylglycinamidine synthase PurS subunit
MEFEVLVKLKDEVLDPEGRAISENLTSQGIQGVGSVEVSKRYVVSLNLNQDKAEDMIKMIAENYLANPVSQTFQIRKIEQ